VGVEGVHLAQDEDRRRAAVNRALNCMHIAAKHFVVSPFVMAMEMQNVAAKPEATIWHDVFLELSLAAFVHIW